MSEPRSDSEFETRATDWRPDLTAALRGLYGDDAATIATDLIQLARSANIQRPQELVALDRRRAQRPDWYQSPERVGYMAYTDRFGSDLQGVRHRIPYLRQLGVDVLHLLSLLEPRHGENDGGYAIRDYLRPDPRLGTSADFAELTSDLRSNGISLCLDFVINHASDDHAWAVAARNGSDYHRDLFITFPDRTQPDAYEQTLPEIFPDMAPGNFTQVDGLGWVWTTFREFQWDLNWANPDVLREVATIAVQLANQGVEILRLDAVAFTWKRLGTNCQNQPEAHLVAQALRAVLAIAAPATILLAEAIVGPDDLVGYLGRHELERRECELAYHNQLMVQGWSMLATGRANLARVALGRLPDPPSRTTWLTYVRCHDDIGWAIDDADAAAVGVTGPGHRRFLADFYRGDFWQSPARGTPFGSNPDTGDERTCGMAATLTGVASGLGTGDAEAVEQGVQRMLLLYGIAFGYGGIPVIYMGDELCQLDDTTYADDPDRRADSRWSHRPEFDDALAELRHDPATTTGRLWQGITQLVEARRRSPQLHGAAPSRPIDVGQPTVFAWRRDHPRFGTLLGLANVGSTPVTVNLSDDLQAAVGCDATVQLATYEVRWLTASSDLTTQP